MSSKNSFTLRAAFEKNLQNYDRVMLVLYKPNLILSDNIH